MNGIVNLSSSGIQDLFHWKFSFLEDIPKDIIILDMNVDLLTWVFFNLLFLLLASAMKRKDNSRGFRLNK